MSYRLLDAFRGLFEGQAYLHRDSSLGDFVAMHLYEDLHSLGRSGKFVARVDAGTSILNTQNKRRGISARRGDGSFGEVVPGVKPIDDPGYAVKRGQIATSEVGVEVKILMKAMIKQIGRVGNDLRDQAQHFRARKGDPICVGIVGVNHAAQTTTYERDRAYPTNGAEYKHPIAEAAEAISRLKSDAASAYDEFLVLRFAATNAAPFAFSWVDERNTVLDYGAILARISQRYERLV